MCENPNGDLAERVCELEREVIDLRWPRSSDDAFGKSWNKWDGDVVARESRIWLSSNDCTKSGGGVRMANGLW